MVRKLALFFIVTAIIVSACGRQVTPDRAGTTPSGLNPGFMQIKFRVQAPFDFSNYRYVIVFNTSGTGTAPYANGANTNYLNYSFEFIVGGTGGVLGGPALYEFYNQTVGGGHTVPQPVQIPYSPGTQLIFNPNSNGQNTEFSIIFDRALLYGIPLTPSPAPTTAPTQGVTPTPVPTTTPIPGTPGPQPTTATQSIWYYNFFTAQQNGTQLIPLDALGNNGVNDVTFGPGNSLDTQASFDITYTVPAAGVPSGATPSTTLTGSEISNAP
ncbi:MAG TPA: hypothetical protein VIJ12_10390 [Candidatus Baltobacteraceae bacterium]